MTAIREERIRLGRSRLGWLLVATYVVIFVVAYFDALAKRGTWLLGHNARRVFAREALMGMESQIKVLGLPLVHIASGRVENGRYHRGIARGWIAVGDVAFGVILAVGGMAVGGISLGGFGIGILAVGGAAAGVLAVGGLAVGAVAIGGAAVAWWAASGGLAVARDFAVGGGAAAQHANDAAAQALVAHHPFFRISSRVLEHSRWLVLLGLLPVVIILLRRVPASRAGAGGPGAGAA